MKGKVGEVFMEDSGSCVSARTTDGGLGIVKAWSDSPLATSFLRHHLVQQVLQQEWQMDQGLAAQEE